MLLLTMNWELVAILLLYLGFVAMLLSLSKPRGKR